MTEFLVRHFIKNPKAIQDQKVRTAYGSLSGNVGICVNVLLFLAKFIVGTISGAVSVTADAFNNLSDAVTSVMSLIGVKMAEKPADEEHPFGHGRIEYISGFIVAFLVLQVGFSLLKSSIGKILHPEDLTVSYVSLFVLCLTVLMKFWLSAFNEKLGKRIRSTVMLATAADARSDMLATSATIFSLFMFRFTGLNVDGACGLIVSAFVLKAGIDIAKDTLEPIIGQRMDPELSEKIMSFVKAYQGVLGVHDLIINNYGPSSCIASIHVELDSSMSLDEAHVLLDRIEVDAKHRLGLLLVTHADPIDTQDPETQRMRSLVQKIVSEEAEQSVSCHDVRLVRGSHGINAVFDLVVPWNYDEDVIRQLVGHIKGRIEKLDSRLRCIITVEHSYGG